MTKRFLLSLTAAAFLALFSLPALADEGPAPFDFSLLEAQGNCVAGTTQLASRPAGDEPPAFLRSCVYSKTCGGWSVTGCCAGGPARQEQKRTCEEKCCQGSLCFSSGWITETRCVSGPC